MIMVIVVRVQSLSDCRWPTWRLLDDPLPRSDQGDRQFDVVVAWSDTKNFRLIRNFARDAE